MTPQDIKDLRSAIHKFGGNKPLNTLLKETLEAWHECPKCQGTGVFVFKEQDYMSHPESPSYGRVYETIRDCDLCDGVGRTERQMKPKMVQQGWE